jgi:hypothetical protein
MQRAFTSARRAGGSAARFCFTFWAPTLSGHVAPEQMRSPVSGNHGPILSHGSISHA